MKALRRNKQPLYYALQTGINEVTDSDSLFTGQYEVKYATPVKVWMNVSPARGQSILEQFGIQEQYDKVLVTDDMSCPIKEDSAIWLEIEPETTVTITVNGVETTTTVQNPHDYLVIRVGKSLNSIAIAVKKI